ncbi:primosomal protein N' [Psychrosphaera aestuarii]|uniref:primosomal protein N' n=1 Tax=Psychrosphaera aestuarii TaxID=1266052 RepID=UPI001B31904E|nr:primosomal protein N' [Psychrosphaera aestuarii]
MALFSQVILHIALPVPLRRLFDYLLPSELETDAIDVANTIEKVTIGQRVVVPFGRQTLVGVVLAVDTHTDQDVAKLKPALSFVENQASFDAAQLQLLNWAAEYYQHPIGDVFSMALPGALRSPKTIDEQLPKVLQKCDELPDKQALPKNAKQIHKLYDVIRSGSFTRDELNKKDITSTTIKKFIDKNWAEWTTSGQGSSAVTASHINEGLALNTEQAIAVAAINAVNHHQCFLIDGVTGSGKTEVYLQAIEHRLLNQWQVLVCVPEIGLTPQTIARFKQRFDVPVALWHSAMTDKQRFDTWQQTRSGKARIVIATRSGIFLPFKSLGMIIIDEEHDASFKQQDGFKYHCRSLALYRAHQANIPVVLGSATPSLETLYNVEQGKFSYLQLQRRAGGSQMPTTHLLDLNRCQTQAALGQPLIDEISNQLDKGRQVMLFINRRGFAPVLMCEECHWLTECGRCSSFTTYHKNSNLLICHHCGFQHPTLHQCLGCGSTRMTPVGTGTEQIESNLANLFPATEIVRLDRDSTSKKGEFDDKLNKINAGQPMIIVGTQMIAKGHHFPNVSLVGIVDVDGALFSSDFRAAEKLSQLVVQVAGRAGRGSIKGQVWLQTKFPEHPVIQDLVNNEYKDFAKYALNERKMLSLPPYSHHIILRAESTIPDLGQQWLSNLSGYLSDYEGLSILGPTPAPMTRKAGKFRHMLIIQSQSRPYLHKLVNWLLENLDTIQKDNRIRWSVDVDPVDLS